MAVPLAVLEYARGDGGFVEITIPTPCVRVAGMAALYVNRRPSPLTGQAKIEREPLVSSLRAVLEMREIKLPREVARLLAAAVHE